MTTNPYSFKNGDLLKNEKGEMLFIDGEPRAFTRGGRFLTVVNVRWVESDVSQNMPLYILRKRFTQVTLSLPSA